MRARDPPTSLPKTPQKINNMIKSTPKKKKLMFLFQEKGNAKAPVNKIGDEIREALIIGENAPHGLDIGIDQDPSFNPPLAPGHHVHLAMHVPVLFLPSCLRLVAVI